MIEPDVLGVGSELSAVEEEQQLVALAVVRCPVHGEQSERLAVDAELLLELATARCGRRLAAFDVAAGDVPGVLVRRVDEQYATLIVEEQRAGGDARGREGLARVGHPTERRAGAQARWSRPASCSRATLRGPRVLRSQLSTS